MTPAEKRIKELIDRWLTSIELHLQYVELSDEAYHEIQAWPKHDRPTRWVLEHAKQKANDLKEAFEARQQMGDSKFADALELMSFLANLVGAQHVDRFVPLAEPQADSDIPKPMPRAPSSKPVTSDVPNWYAQAAKAQVAATPPMIRRPAVAEAVKQAIPQRPEMPASLAPPMSAVPPPKPPVRATDPEATREMPKLAAQVSPSKQPDSKKPTPKPSAPAPKQTAKVNADDEIDRTVIADAIRLMTWGRTWHELAELIARMADRPSLADVRKILRAHRATIEKAAKESAGKEAPAKGKSK